MITVIFLMIEGSKPVSGWQNSYACKWHISLSYVTNLHMQKGQHLMPKATQDALGCDLATDHMVMQR